MTREQTLDRAKEIVTGHRETDYGSPEDSFANIAELWSWWLGFEISSYDVGMMMSLLKIARIRTAVGIPTEDCFIDLAGYAACTSEIVRGVSVEEDDSEE